MNTVITGYTIPITEANQQEPVLPAFPDENAVASKDHRGIPVKRFGSADIWKIHSGKRHVNVYPRRA